MISEDRLNDIADFKSRNISTKIFTEIDSEFVKSIQRDFTDSCIFQVSLSDGTYVFEESDQIIFGEDSVFVRQFRVGEVYTKNNGETDAELNYLAHKFSYKEIKSIGYEVSNDKSRLIFELEDGRIVTSVGVPDNGELVILSARLDNIITDNNNPFIN